MGNAASSAASSGAFAAASLHEALRAIEDDDADALRELVRSSRLDVPQGLVDPATGRTALHFAAECDSPKALRYLATVGARCLADARWRGPAGRGATALCVAAELGHLECARVLLGGDGGSNSSSSSSTSFSADPGLAREDDGMTPLMLAVVGGGHEKIVELLLEDPRTDVAARSGGAGPALSLSSSRPPPGRASSGLTAAALARNLGYDRVADILDRNFSMASRRGKGIVSYGLAVDDAPSPSASSSSSSSSSSSRNTGRFLPDQSASTSPSALMAEGEKHAALGRLEAAVGCFTRALALSESEAPKAGSGSNNDAGGGGGGVRTAALLARASALRALGQREAARLDYDGALAILLADRRIVDALAGRAACALPGDGDGEDGGGDKDNKDDPRALRSALPDLELAVRLAKMHEARPKQPEEKRQQRQGAAAAAASAAANNSPSKDSSPPLSSSHLSKRLERIERRLEAIDSTYVRRVPGSEKSHYQVLKVPEDADDARIRAAYRALARAAHPDKVSHWAEEGAARRMAAKAARINGAYEVLSDPTRRAFYDLELRAARESGR
jgi:DnaJ-domain-containing protein 1